MFNIVFWSYLCISGVSTVVSHFFIDLGLLLFLSLAKGLSILFIFSKSQFFLQQLYLLIFGCAAHGRSQVGVPGPQRCGVGPMPRAQSEPGSPALEGRLPPPGSPGKLSPPVSKAWLELTRLSGILSLQTSLWLTCSPSSALCLISVNKIYLDILPGNVTCPLSTQSSSGNSFSFTPCLTYSIPCWGCCSLPVSAAFSLLPQLHKLRLSADCCVPSVQDNGWGVTHSINIWWMKAWSWFLTYCGPHDTHSTSGW